MDVSVYEAKTHLSRLIGDVEAGREIGKHCLGPAPRMIPVGRDMVNVGQLASQPWIKTATREPEASHAMSMIAAFQCDDARSPGGDAGEPNCRFNGLRSSRQ